MEYSSSSSDEDDGIEAIDKESFLPSIGPPKVLQYVKESVNPPFTNEFPDRDSYPSGSSKGDNLVHSCAFCKTEVLEKIDVAQHVFQAQTVSTTFFHLLYFYNRQLRPVTVYIKSYRM